MVTRKQIKGIIKKFKKGYLKEVINKKGTKKAIQLGEGRKGWDATYKGSFKKVPRVKPRPTPEKMAIRLAKKGHKRVEILD